LGVAQINPEYTISNRNGGEVKFTTPLGVDDPQRIHQLHENLITEFKEGLTVEGNNYSKKDGPGYVDKVESGEIPPTGNPAIDLVANSADAMVKDTV